MMNRRTFVAASTAAFGLSGRGAHATTQADVIALGGAVTEIVFALGQGHRLLARDTTSTYPDAATRLPDVGYLRRLSAEGVLSFGPSLIVSAEGAGPPEVVDILRAAAVEFAEVPEGFDSAAIAKKIAIVGAALDVPEQTAALITETEATLTAATATASLTDAPRKRVMFVLSTQGGRVLASGENTGADGIIKLAGGANAVSGFEGYKPLSDEAVTAAQPDVILMMDREGDHAASNAELFALPALSSIPAAETESVVRMDGLLMLGFGPRTAQAVQALHSALYEAG